ncbi:Uncharacterised protein [Moraxella lacunata]|uniref:Uncharacterized protein n=1 Tax=Moraxella lacunata TaxID=477 RepID=A0A378QFF1_MORLA|nr:hypothetical protein [Moraxella lacunata]STY99626.1 Uncharacterised protein [Moraxella lacunata]
MQATMKDVFYHTFPVRALPALFLCLSVTLTACSDKHPTANIPDTPLEKPLDIIIEPKKVARQRIGQQELKRMGHYGLGEVVRAKSEPPPQAIL